MQLSDKIAAWCVGTLIVGLIAGALTLVCGLWCSDPQFVLGETVRLPGGGTAVVVEVSVATTYTPNYVLALPGGATFRVNEKTMQKQETK